MLENIAAQVDRENKLTLVKVETQNRGQMEL